MISRCRGIAEVFWGAAIHVDGMVAAFAQELSAMLFKMSDQIAPLHAAVIASGSRRTSAPCNDSSAKSRFAWSTISTASFKFSRASSVAPYVFAPGSSSTKAA